MTTQDLINTLKQGKPMTDKLVREIVRELEEKGALRKALEKIDAMQDGEFLNYDLAKKYARQGLYGRL
jgi:uncharacterized protein (DUF2164 family)